MSGIEAEAPGLRIASGYAYPDVLVETEWLAAHLHDPAIRVIEVDEDVLLYDTGHIPGAVKLNWHIDVQDTLVRDFLDRNGFDQLMRRWGITDDTTIIFYGDKYNWYACYSYWLFTMYGHKKMKILNGGRIKWEIEQRTMTSEVPHVSGPTSYHSQIADETIRAFRDDVRGALRNPNRRLIDVRSPQEYRGELVHMVNYPQEGASRGGHIPGAKNIPWSLTVNLDGTFKSAEELRQLYGSHDITPDKEVITYCRIGERSAHTWFVLTKLLGFPRVRNYDGSWTEWGCMVRVPIEK
jgi:thiosulfate/3-mercaptopyruvate sulfurtransferase